MTNPKTNTNAFKNYFVNVGPTLVCKIPDQVVDISIYMPSANECSLLLTPTSENEIKRAIANFNNLAPWKDGVTAKIFEIVSDAMVTPSPISHIYRLYREYSLKT